MSDAEAEAEEEEFTCAIVEICLARAPERLADGSDGWFICSTDAAGAALARYLARLVRNFPDHEFYERRRGTVYARLRTPS
jgi:hypothetical protein